MIEHIILPTDADEKAAYEKTKADDLALWKRLDVVVLAIYLNKEFTNTNLIDFSTKNAYCNRLKSLADQLAIVGTPVTDHSMVLKMLQGLTKQYSKFFTVMQNKKTLPTFAIARSKLALEETTLLERAKQDSGSTSLVANNYSSDVGSSFQTPYQNNNTKYRNKNNANGDNYQASGGRSNHCCGSKTGGG
ncbi:uncharacterized protein LOC131638593 [Vicia villosa]|uniref:uncharacterized protein LOC131638593 n=1 Tax=Vicia villosa TaxID=3911 RepID=UPI00273B0B27|nr:uncharacterized protein LOC131638593 [Vicia villosa]